MGATVDRKGLLCEAASIGIFPDGFSSTAAAFMAAPSPSHLEDRIAHEIAYGLRAEEQLRVDREKEGERMAPETQPHSVAPGPIMPVIEFC